MTDEDWEILNNGKNNMLLGGYMDASKLETSKELVFQYSQMCGHRLNKLENKNILGLCDWGNTSSVIRVFISYM